MGASSIDHYTSVLIYFLTNQSGLPVVFFAQVEALLLCGVLGSNKIAVRWLLLHFNQIELAG